MIHRSFEAFKRVTLEEAWGGMWLQEPFRDSGNWFPDADEKERLLLSERVLRELVSEGLIVLVHTRTEEVVPEDEYDRMFGSSRWQSSESDDRYDDVQYRQTDKAADRTA